MTPTPPPAVERILARRVVCDGIEYGLSLVTVRGDDVSITPFAGETASTTYYPGTLIISHDTDGVPAIVRR